MTTIEKPGTALFVDASLTNIPFQIPQIFSNLIHSSKFSYMKYILLALFSLACFAGFAQRTVDVNQNIGSSAINPNHFMVVGGQPFVNTKFSKVVEGTPYFRDEWMKGNVVVAGGKEYAGFELKLDLVYNELHYKDASGAEMISSADITKVVLFDTVAQRIYRFINSSDISPYIETDKGWYLLLSDVGGAAVYKRIVKALNENKPYGSATIEQSIKTSNKYYVFYKNTFTQVKKLKDIPDVLTDKKTQLAQYITSQKLSEKNEDDFEKLMQYYGTLKQ